MVNIFDLTWFKHRFNSIHKHTNIPFPFSVFWMSISKQCRYLFEIVSLFFTWNSEPYTKPETKSVNSLVLWLELNIQRVFEGPHWASSKKNTHNKLITDLWRWWFIFKMRKTNIEPTFFSLILFIVVTIHDVLIWYIIMNHNSNLSTNYSNWFSIT